MRQQHARNASLRMDLWSDLPADDMSKILDEQARELHSLLNEVAVLVGDASEVKLEGMADGAAATTSASSASSLETRAQMEKIKLDERVRLLESEVHELKGAVNVAHVEKAEATRLHQIEKQRVAFLEKSLKETEDELRQYADSNIGANTKLARLAHKTHNDALELAADEEMLRTQDVELNRLKRDLEAVTAQRDEFRHAKDELASAIDQRDQARSDVNTALDAVSQWEQRFVLASENAKRLREREEQTARKVVELQEALRRAEEAAETARAGNRSLDDTVATSASPMSVVKLLPVQMRSMCTLLSLDTRNPHICMNRGGGASFGRDTTSTVVLDGKDISHNHARIFYEPDYDAEGVTDDLLTPWVLEDLSTNGVFVNFVKLGNGARHRLKHGDAIWLSKLACKTPKTTNHAFVFQVTSTKMAVAVPPWDVLKSGTKQGRVVDDASNRSWVALP